MYSYQTKSSSMCFSNTKHVCEGVPVSSLRKGLNVRFEWKCSNAQTQMLRHMALHEVTKQDCTQKELPSLLQAINCYWPNSEYPANITPRVQRRMEVLFHNLVLDGIIQSTRLSTGGWSSEWPAWTKNWLKMDWTGDTSPPSDISHGRGTIIDLSDLKETLAEAVPTSEVAMTMNPFPISPPESADIVMPDACDIPAVLESTRFPMTPQDSPIRGFRPQGMFPDRLPSGSTTSFNQTFFQGYTPSVTSVTSFNPTLASHHGNQEDPTPVHYTAFNQTLAPNLAQLHSTPTSCTSFNQVFLPREAKHDSSHKPPKWAALFWVWISASK
ncbi:hypothetical protein BHE90_013299 [Fusarium euwallaceae]|uniref:Uncharacterized protein n=1 Tax=Fusarium euwallaceae TaxID=1147111 RepID=A0A430L961_9HYPO|nr:hypothetical protein BHE90_013299 [Fusarium euwallaceae]